MDCREGANFSSIPPYFKTILYLIEMKNTKVILELYMEIWHCYEDGKSMYYSLFTTTSYEDAEAMCKKKKYEVVQVIDLELQDFEE